MMHGFSKARTVSSEPTRKSSRRATVPLSDILQLMLSETSDLLVCLDTKLDCLFANHAFLKTFSLDQDEVLGNPLSNHFDPRLYTGVLQPHLEKSLAGAKVCFERWIKTAASGLRFMEINAAPFHDRHGAISGLIVSVRDTTPLKQMEDELRQAHKMEAIGTIAGGIAHEFNNLLGIIIGNTELAMDDTPTWSSPYKNLEEIRNASFRAKDVVRKLIGYSRKQKAKLIAISPAPLISDVVQFLRSSLPASVVIRNDLDPDCPKIQADPAQIHQIVLLIARHVMQTMVDNTGIVSIRLIRIPSDSQTPTDSDTPQRRSCVGLLVGRDDTDWSPPGMQMQPLSPDQADQEEGADDTDLAVVRRIVRSHNATLEIRRDPLNKYRQYAILFPIFDDPFEIENKATPPAGQKRLNILFIDDEPGMLVIGRRVLESLGHHVTVERDPTQALEMLLRDTDAYDLIITDLTMPALTGDKLAKQVTKLKPDLPILMCTGHTHHLDAEKLAACGIKGVLAKPFTRDDLGAAIANVLPETMPFYGDDEAA